MITESLSGIGVSALATIAFLATVRYSHARRKTLVGLAVFTIMNAACAAILFLFTGLSAPILLLAVCSNSLCILMLYAIVSRSISFDLLSVVAVHRNTGVNGSDLVAGDPLNVYGRLQQLRRVGLVRLEGSVYRINRFGAIVSWCVVKPLYWMRKNES
jgi:hypothetical protein